MTRQWLRDLRLVAQDGGKYLDLSGLRVVFNVQASNKQSPNIADIFVYNVAKQTAKRFVNKEFTKVTLEAGYRGNLGIVFKGNIKAAHYNRDNPTDTVLALYCGDGDDAYQYAHVSKTFAAGSKPMDQVNEALKQMQPFGVTKGYIAGVPDFAYKRPVTIFESARDTLRRICELGPVGWSIQNQQLQIVPKQGRVPGGPVLLNATTGLIGKPVQTMGGIQIRCLIRPELRIDHVVQVDNASIQQTAPFRGNVNEAQNYKVPDLDADGLYKILVLTRSGDTHQQTWYDDLVCLSASGSGWTPNNLIQYMTNSSFAGA